MTFIDAKEVRALVDRLVDAAYLDGIQELDAMSDETLRARSALEQVLSQQDETLAKYQPCGCVTCTCEDEKQCQGCGAKHCGNRTDHPAYVKRQPEAWITPGGDVSRSFHWCLERCLPGQLPLPLYAAQQSAEAHSRIVTRQLLHWGGVPVHVTGTITTSPGNWSLIDAALTEYHNE